MNHFYLSPSSLTFKQYNNILAKILAYGWTATFVWPRETFTIDCYLNTSVLKKAIRALSRTDLYIAHIPGTFSGNIELGMAYTLCEEVFIAAKDPVHFTQTGPADAYISTLPAIRRVCCAIEDIPAMLEQEYLYLIDIKKHQF